MVWINPSSLTILFEYVFVDIVERVRDEPRWHPNLLHFRGTKTVTQLQYYSYRLMVHADDFPHLHHSSRLTQEYVVDCFCKIEEAGLDWCRRNQQQLRAETYQGLMDEIVNNLLLLQEV